MNEPPAIAPVITAGARGIGHAVVGPLVGSALAAPEVQAAVVRLVVIAAAGVAAGTLLGVWIGLKLGGSK